MSRKSVSSSVIKFTRNIDKCYWFARYYIVVLSVSPVSNTIMILILCIVQLLLYFSYLYE